MRRLLIQVFCVALLVAPSFAAAQDLTPQKGGVVKIVSTNPDGKVRVGTGFIVKLENGTAYIVTAYHVVEGDSNPKVEFYTRQNIPVTGEFKQGHSGLDLAMLIVRGTDNLPEGIRALAVLPAEGFAAGEDVATIGFPRGLGPWAVTKANIAAQDGPDLTLSGAIDQGSSGAPVFRNGAVVAMVTSALGPAAGRAIPSEFFAFTLRGWSVTLAKSGPESSDAVSKSSDMTPGKLFRDCADCPEMVVVGGERFFWMGSPGYQAGRRNDEGPAHEVQIPGAFSVSKFEITRAQFARFVRASGRQMSGGCYVFRDEPRLQLDASRSWLDPGFPQGDDHPVVCVSFEDATAYVEWLAKQTGKPYRLLSEAEWEYAARAGTTTSRSWGDSEQQACEYANVGDRRGKANHPNWTWPTFDCDDRYAETAPVGKYKANAFGLHDMLGNVFEWVQDCWNGSYDGAPTNASAWVTGECDKRVMRGGSWFIGPVFVRSAGRGSRTAAVRDSGIGFRVARTLP